MSEELFAYEIRSEGSGYLLVLRVAPSSGEKQKEYRIFLHHDTALDLSQTLQEVARGQRQR